MIIQPRRISFEILSKDLLRSWAAKDDFIEILFNLLF